MDNTRRGFDRLRGLAPGEGGLPESADTRALVVALAGAVGVDCLVFALATASGLGLESANALAFAAGLATALVIFARARGSSRDTRLPATALAVIVILAFAMHAGVLGLFVTGWRVPPALAIGPAALSGAAVGLAGSLFVAAVPAHGPDSDFRWSAAAVVVFAYLLALRLVYLGQLELVPQEGYYWQFAQHPDLSYLDHPPLVAWLIAAALTLGKGEWFVRLPAVVCSLATVAFAAALARELAGERIAWRTALLATALPFFFGVGMVMTPDAPLTTAWAAALYFLARALLRGEERAWLAAGVAIGLGMLSKYTMILVPLAALAFAIVDRRLRRVLFSPWPWLGALLALAVFSPVFVWNLRHDWASFAYQGSRRLDPEARTFGLHLFVLFLFLVVTPWGIAGLWRGAVRGLAARRLAQGARGDDGTTLVTDRPLRFALVFTLVPLVPLAITSLWSETKFHWTGPIWLAALPVIAASMAAPLAGEPARPADRWLARTWPALVHVLLVVYAIGLFYYPVYGLAGVRAHHKYVATGWRDLREQVQRIEDEVARETGARPAIIGLDKHNLANQMAFYDPRGDGPRDTASRNVVVDADALMYELWFSPQDFAGRNLIVVACDRGAVEDPRLAAQAARTGPVTTLAVRKGGVHTKDCYARVLYRFSPAPRSPDGRSG